MKRDEKRLRGWVHTRGQGGTPESIVLADRKGLIRGLGNIRREYRPRGPGEATWTAWVHRSWRKKTYTVFVVLDDGRVVCPIGEATPPDEDA
jgi:aspartyl/asparaginyl-tRNA synthetase